MLCCYDFNVIGFCFVLGFFDLKIDFSLDSTLFGFVGCQTIWRVSKSIS